MIKIAVFAILFLFSHVVSAGDDSVVFQTLCKVAFMGQRAAAELNVVSTNQSIQATIRTVAVEALRNHDKSATNSFQTLDAFVRGWSVTNEPPLNTDTIALMKRSLELGYSATTLLAAFAADTNRPPPIRVAAARFLTTIR